MKIKLCLSHEPIAHYRIDLPPSPLYIFALSSLQAHIRSLLISWHAHRGAIRGVQLKKHSHSRDSSSLNPSGRLNLSVQREDSNLQAWIISLRSAVTPQGSSVIFRLWFFTISYLSPLIFVVYHFAELAPSSLKTALCSSLSHSRFSAGRSSVFSAISPLLALSLPSLEQFPSTLWPFSFLSSSSPSFCSLEMAENQDHSIPVDLPENQEMPQNPLDRVITNNNCTL